MKLNYLIPLIAFLFQFICYDRSQITFQINKIEGLYKIFKEKTKFYFGTTTPIYGNSSSLSYYYVNIFLGDNPQIQSVIIDTGSHLTAVPCRPLILNCGVHMNPYYNMNSSNLSKIVDCKSDTCKSFDFARCEPDKTCFYSNTYGEGSSITGIIVEDVVRFGDNFHSFKPVVLPFGCIRYENKHFYDQQVDGIMGLGPGPSSFVNLLNKYDVIPTNIFSLCFAPNGGYFSIGGINDTFHTGNISYAPYYETSFYRIKLKNFYVNSIDFQSNNTEYFTVIDSGTTISYFPNKLFQEFNKQLNIFCSKVDKCLGDSYSTDNGICFQVKDGINFNEFIGSMPDIYFYFENNVKFTWKPISYLHKSTDDLNNDSLTMCIGLTEWGSNDILLGSTWMHNHDIIFDIKNKRIGFVESLCSGKNNDIDYSNNLTFFNKKTNILGIIIFSTILFTFIAYYRLNKLKTFNGIEEYDSLYYDGEKKFIILINHLHFNYI